MLTVTVELHPGGYSGARRTLATMRISNLSDLADVSDYQIESLEGANRLSGAPPYSSECVVVAHDRRQSVWVLIAKAASKIQTADAVEF